MSTQACALRVEIRQDEQYLFHPFRLGSDDSFIALTTARTAEGELQGRQAPRGSIADTLRAARLHHAPVERESHPSRSDVCAPELGLIRLTSSLPAGRDNEERTKFCDRRVRHIEIAVFVEHAVPGPFTGRHLRNHRELALLVRTGDGKLRGFSSANIQQVRSRRI